MIRIAILAVALVAGGGAAWLAQSMLGDEGAPVADAPEPLLTREALVATAPIERGAELGPGNLRWQAWPESSIGERMILRDEQPDAIETYTGWISRSPLLPGEPLRPERLAEGDGGLMSLMLAPGMRAVAVRVSAESGAGGFIMPNDRIDVIHTTTRDVDNDGTGEPHSSTIIPNARVLAVDQVFEETEAGAAKVAETATLELTPAQAELLTSARNTGGLSMALRSAADFGETTDGELSVLPPATASAPEQPSPPEQDEQKAPETAAAATEAIAEERRKVTDVRIIRSGQVETVQVGPNDG